MFVHHTQAMEIRCSLQSTRAGLVYYNNDMVVGLVNRTLLYGVLLKHTVKVRYYETQGTSPIMYIEDL